MRLIGFVLALPCAASLAAPAQDPRPPVFESEATMVRLSVAVMSELTAPLTATDFAVFDNGRKQEVSFFDAKPMSLDISMFVDISGSMSVRENLTLKVYLRPGIPESAKQFVDILKPGDRMEVVEFADRIRTLQEFTEDKELLRSAVDRLGAGGERTLLMRTLYIKLHELKRIPRDPERVRRRVLVFITDGIDTGSGMSEKTMQETARQAEASIYMLALAPIVLPFETAEEMQASAQSRWLMQQVCQDTGGAFLPAKTPAELGSLAKRLTAEMAAEYTIGWVPNAPAGKGPWHTIQVTVRGIPTDRLRHRSGYLASKP